MGNGRLYSKLGSFLVPNRFQVPMAASKIGPQLPGCLAGLFIHAATARNYNFYNYNDSYGSTSVYSTDFSGAEMDIIIF